MTISHKESLSLLNALKEELKETETVQDLCEEHGLDVSIIDYIPMAFADLDVSARTDQGCIYFTYFSIIKHIICHYLYDNTQKLLNVYS